MAPRPSITMAAKRATPHHGPCSPKARSGTYPQIRATSPPREDRRSQSTIPTTSGFTIEPREDDVRAGARNGINLHDPFVALRRQRQAAPRISSGLIHCRSTCLRLQGMGSSEAGVDRRRDPRANPRRYAASVHQLQLHKYVPVPGPTCRRKNPWAIMYRLASVFVFPSLYEDSASRPLEAMASRQRRS